jgi:pantetheine-phosphate adenylyltransferase
MFILPHALSMDNQKIIVFPGSFDPITLGHAELVRRAVPLFDKIIVAIGQNSQKKYLYSLEQRIDWLKTCFADEPKIEISSIEGLTAHFCQKVNAKYILRGLRNASDFDYEKTISQLNSIVGEGLETIFLISAPQYSHISSTIVREIIKGGGNAAQFLPTEITLDFLKEKQ